VIAKHQRLGVFVDVQNMFYSAKYQYRSKLDFSKLLEHAVQGRELVRAIAYLVQTPDIDQSHFITMLQQTGYEVRAKTLRLRPDGTAKGDWDMGIALDTLSLSDRLDTIVMVTGDGDFVDLVSLLKARGTRVEVLSFPFSTAEELKVAASEFRPIGPGLLLGAPLGLPASGIEDPAAFSSDAPGVRQEPGPGISASGSSLGASHARPGAETL